jgi:hypothetical protein
MVNAIFYAKDESEMTHYDFMIMVRFFFKRGKGSLPAQHDAQYLLVYSRIEWKVKFLINSMNAGDNISVLNRFETKPIVKYSILTKGYP